MRDIAQPRLLYAKAILLVLTGLLSAALLIAQRPQWTTAFLLIVCVWGFARAYYFAFYVIERYADPAFRFSGLRSFVAYLFARRRSS